VQVTRSYLEASSSGAGGAARGLELVGPYFNILIQYFILMVNISCYTTINPAQLLSAPLLAMMN